LLFIYAGIFVGNGDDDVMALPSPIVIVFEVCLLLYFIIITFFTIAQGVAGVQDD